MSRGPLLIAGGQIIVGFMPVDMNTGANDGDWVELGANFTHCTVVALASIGTAGQDPILAMQQAKTNAGGSAKDLDFTEIWHKVGATAISAVAQFTKVTQAAAASYDSDPIAGAENELMLVAEFDANDLDVNGGFTHLRGRVADVGAAAQLGTLLYILTQPRKVGDPTPGAI